MTCERLTPVFLAGIALLVYINAFFGVFQFDDYNVIVTNEVVHSWRGWLSDFPHGIRPLLKLTYLLNWLSGLGTFGFHLFNNAVHAGNTCLIYFLTQRFFRRTCVDIPTSGLLSPPSLTALLFAVHPLQSEAVTYICGRSTSLMALFYLGSLLAYVRGREEEKWKLIYLLSPLLFLLAMLTKETAVTLPFALLLWEFSVNGIGGKRKAILRVQAIHWLLLIIIFLALLVHPRYRDLLLFSLETRSMAENILSEINGIIYLVSRLFFVTKLNIDPDLPVIKSWTLLLTAEASLLAGMLCTGILALRRSPALAFGLIWFFLHLVPTNSLIPRLDVANERQLYLADWGVFMITSYGIWLLAARYRNRQRLIVVTVVSIMLFLACAAVIRNRVYRSETALWEDTARKSPGKARVFNNLGYAYALAGKEAEAESAFNEALRLAPDFIKARQNLNDVRRNRALDLYLQFRERQMRSPD